MNIQTIIDQALRGESVEGYSVTIYWDNQDQRNKGPAYRVIDERGHEETGSLAHWGWLDADGQDYGEPAGYELVHYFGLDDGYAGPDSDGIYPDLRVA